MKRMRNKLQWALLGITAALAGFLPVQAQNELTRTIVDARGITVTIPADPQRVATVSDALIEELMIIFGVQERVVGIGSTCLVREFSYEYQSVSGETYKFDGGMNPANFLYPQLRDLQLFVQPGTEINFETLAAFDPDLVIIDLGACTLKWTEDPAAMQLGLSRLESLGIPVVILQGPNAGGTPGIESLTNNIRILGEVFNQGEKAKAIATYLEDSIRLVFDRTKDISEADKPSVLLLGLNPNVREEGGVGSAFGLSDIQSYFVEEIVHARNAFQQKNNAILNPEQILALDPDVIILPTSNGYHPPRELTDTVYFENIQTLQAIENNRIGALPWSPCNCDKRLEYPLDVIVIAKYAYPELFSDIDLAAWTKDFYKTVYGVSDEQAAGLLHAQWMDWTLE